MQQSGPNRPHYYLYLRAGATRVKQTSQKNKTEIKIYEAWRTIRYNYKGFLAGRDLGDKVGRRGAKRKGKGS